MLVFPAPRSDRSGNRQNTPERPLAQGGAIIPDMARPLYCAVSCLDTVVLLMPGQADVPSMPERSASAANCTAAYSCRIAAMHPDPGRRPLRQLLL